jgi:hypothetical protein
VTRFSDRYTCVRYSDGPRQAVDTLGRMYLLHAPQDTHHKTTSETGKSSGPDKPMVIFDSNENSVQSFCPRVQRPPIHHRHKAGHRDWRSKMTLISVVGDQRDTYVNLKLYHHPQAWWAWRGAYVHISATIPGVPEISVKEP